MKLEMYQSSFYFVFFFCLSYAFIVRCFLSENREPNGSQEDKNDNVERVEHCSKIIAHKEMNWNPKQVRPEIAILYRRIVDSLNQKEPEGMKGVDRDVMHLEAFIKSQTSSTEVKKELPGFATNAADKETTSKANVLLANCPTYGLSQDVTCKLPVSCNGEDKKTCSDKTFYIH